MERWCLIPKQRADLSGVIKTVSFSRAEGKLLAAYYERSRIPRLKFLLVQPLCVQVSPALLHIILWELGLGNQSKIMVILWVLIVLWEKQNKTVLYLTWGSHVFSQHQGTVADYLVSLQEELNLRCLAASESYKSNRVYVACSVLVRS